MPSLTPVDLVVAVVLALVVLGAVRAGRGLLPALASGALTALALWLAAGAALALGPQELRAPVARSGFATTLDPPAWAFDRLA